MQTDAGKTIFNEVQKRRLEVNVLINDAGIGSGGDFLEHELKSELDMMQLNMQALVALRHCFLATNAIG